MAKGRDRVYTSLKNDHLFKELKESKDSPLKDKKTAEIFFLAVATGFTLGKRQPLGKRETGGYCRFEYMSEEQLGLIKAIAIHEKGDLSVVLDPETMYPIAEEYANAGIHFLHKDVMGDTEVSFIKKLEASLADKIKSSSK